MIQVEKLTKQYSDRTAVDQISFQVARGEILGFLGQNGAGKTTTMKVLTCFIPSTDGKVSVAGFDVFEQPEDVKKRVGYLPEAPPVYPELTVREYLNFASELRAVPKQNRAKRFDTVVEMCKLGEVRDRLIGNLSKGFRQRVGIAQALIHDPEVVVLDEPTVGLDPKQVTEVRSLIQSMRGTKTVIYSTHILSEVAATCDRILVIDRGKIVAQEAIARMGSSGGTAKTALVVQRFEPSLITALSNVPGVKSVKSREGASTHLIVETLAKDDVVTQVAQTVVEKGFGLLQMAPVQLALEDYYLSLISGRAAS